MAIQVIELTMKRLKELNQPFKYIVTCAIMQKNGAGLHMATSTFWDNSSDGEIHVFFCLYPHTVPMSRCVTKSQRSHTPHTATGHTGNTLYSSTDTHRSLDSAPPPGHRPRGESTPFEKKSATTPKPSAASSSCR